MKQPHTSIGIAVVFYNDCFLVGTRGDNVPLAGKAEFPGGKCEEGESTEACAIRECFEETGLKVITKKRLYQTEHHYPHGLLYLTFWHCVPANIEDVCEKHCGYHWVKKTQLATYHFPEANHPVIKMLMTQSHENQNNTGTET
ncbi:hypothetical protein MNBD_PLANCTO02-1053 [hydrothermal vent metagenome]|uniref:8-oxo-dGTP diphosphatase n=1 Tax=hydrothermal vent metagenome TaxID=652676 RepID=A0A3B1DLE8_9ZZZZ